MIQNDDDTWSSAADMFGDDAWKRIIRRSELEQNIENASGVFGKLEATRRFYKDAEPEILATFRKSRFLWAFSYPFDWSRIFSPIEQMAWSAIRCKGRIVLYPQYPALNYWMDFANPGLKIGLELDGKEFHDKGRDSERDKRLQAEGWKVYRISGKEMYRTNFKDWFLMREEEIWDEDDVVQNLRHWLYETGDGIIEAIKQIHFTGTDYYGPYEEHSEYVYGKYLEYCHNTLDMHQLNS